MKSLIDDWNESLESRIQLVEDHNRKVEEEFKSGNLLPEAAIAAALKKPSRVTYPTESWLRWWKSAWGWTLLSRSGDEAAWLPYDDVDMAQAREEVQKLISQHGCHPYLILNFDQLWRNAFALQKVPLMYKDRAGTGHRSGKSKTSSKTDKKIHHIRGSRRSLTVTWLCFS